MLGSQMDRRYNTLIASHFAENRQMLFLSGPRQVGKTFTSRAAAAAWGENFYLNWDALDDRRVIAAGAGSIAARLELDRVRSQPPMLVLDEIHKFAAWKDTLKGLFDTRQRDVRILATGSARMNVFKRGGDSLMGRYFPYRIHPLSVAELAPNADLGREGWEGLQQLGGFPEPYLRADKRFWRRWRRTRTQQLMREDLRDLTGIRELDQVELLAELIRLNAGQLTNYSSYAKHIQVSVDTIRRWLGTLESLYYCFSIRPWHTNVARSLRKQPKYYLWDWSAVDNKGPRNENLVACALLKAVHWWTDIGEGDFDLHFIRDKQKREVDFVVVRDGKPWFLVEVKSSGGAQLSRSLLHFHETIGTTQAFQVALDADYVDVDCFSLDRPRIVPARTLLSQLI